MSIKVTISNYKFPISFSHNGWNVRLEKRIEFFKDIAVEAFFTPPLEPDLVFWCSKIPMLVQEIATRSGLYPSQISREDMTTYQAIAQRYVKSISYPAAQSYRVSANGGLIDRFFGQNLSATDKVIDKIVNYMNHNLPKLTEFSVIVYVNTLQDSGVNSNIIAILSQFPRI
jgi:hypothetical protein